MKNKSFVSRFTGELVLIFITILWGSTFVIVKQALADLSSTLYVAIRFSIAAAILFPIFLFVKKKDEKMILKEGVILGVLLFLGFVTQTYGLQITTATKSAFITGTFVVMIPFFQIFIEKKKPSLGTVIGIFLVFVGLMLLSSGGNSVWEFVSSLGRDFNTGDFLTFLCAVFFAIQVVLIDKYSKEHSVMGLLFSQLVTVAPLSFLFTFIFNASSIEPVKADFNGFVIFSLLFTAIVATLFNIGMQTKFQKTVSPSKAGIIYSFEPLFASILAYFVLNEKISNFGYIGGVLIIAGLIISEIYDNLFKANEKGSSEV
jgi:drug/metabolite transporter (DMT)-like permease